MEKKLKTQTDLSAEPVPAEVEFFKQFYDEAYLYIQQGLSLEEIEDAKSAVIFYEKGLRQIDQALSFRIVGEDRVGPEWEKVASMQKKMRRTRLEILERLSTIRLSPSASADNLESDQPPSYEETMRNTSQYVNTSVNGTTQSKDSEHLKDKVITMNSVYTPAFTDSLVTEIPENTRALFTLRDVQIFFVSPEGFVTAPSYPTSLTIYKFEEGASNVSRVPAFLQVGEWIFPLIPGHSPVLQTNYGAYLFPDTSQQRPGAAVGLLLSDDTDDSVRTVFEHVLCELTVLRQESEPSDSMRLSRRISEGIVKGAEVLARGVGYGAEITSRLVHLGARKLRERINPASEPTTISPQMREGLHIARDVTGVAVKVSGFIVRKVGEATMSLGRYLAPHIRKHGTQLLSKALNESPNESGNKINSVLEVAAGGMRGFGTVFVGLESAARLLASNLANETVEIVNHKYGSAASDVAGNTLFTVGNIAMAAYNVHACGVKGIAKQTAKSTAKALVSDYEAGTYTSQQNGCVDTPSQPNQNGSIIPLQPKQNGLPEKEKPPKDDKK